MKDIKNVFNLINIIINFKFIKKIKGQLALDLV